MGEIKPAEYYNDYYKQDMSYHVHYKESNYYNLWKEVLKLIDDEKLLCKILDAGCGTGQFANMLYDYGVDNYMGIDFSR
ncbi:MAG: class I SAM-dependent methyltransferase, partial [Candidatus Hodarchaeales archaeon]